MKTWKTESIYRCAREEGEVEKYQEVEAGVEDKDYLCWLEGDQV